MNSGGAAHLVAARVDYVVDDADADARRRLLAAILFLLIAPLFVFQAAKLIELVQLTFLLDLNMWISVVALSAVSLLVVKCVRQYNRNSRSKGHKGGKLKSTNSTIFGIFSSSPLFGAKQTNERTASHPKQTQADHESSFRQKIDPRYFKPKFILNELVTFWGTTCAVVTWGSFYVIGGTIVATEKLAKKIKTKYNQREQQHNSSQGTGRFDSFTSSFSFGNDSSSSIPTSDRANKDPLRRVSSWTKKSFTSIKKKFSKFVGTSLPQITASRTD